MVLLFAFIIFCAFMALKTSSDRQQQKENLLFEKYKDYSEEKLEDACDTLFRKMIKRGQTDQATKDEIFYIMKLCKEKYNVTLDYNTMMKKADKGLVELYTHNKELMEMDKKTNELINNLNNPSKKEKSVVGQAVAGGIIAGPAGAVVGALDAVDKNNKIRSEKK